MIRDLSVPVTEPSSRDLHPTSGARFAFDRIGEAPEPSYEVRIYLPEDRTWLGKLEWVEGRAALEPSPTPDDAELVWAHAEALKLARVLHRDPRPHMLRWRGP